MMNKVEFWEDVKRFNGKRVLVVGDVGLDRYIHGVSTRLCPEAPVPVFTESYAELRPGLAGNVASNVVSLGGEVRLCSLIGDDQNGVDFCDAIDQAKIKGVEEYIGKVPERKTTVKNRYYVGRQMLLRVDEETDQPYPTETMNLFTAGVCREIETWAEVVVIQDYAKGLITRELVRAMVQSCATRSIKILVDPSPKQSPVIYAGCHYLKPNQAEAEAMVLKMDPQRMMTYAYDVFADYLSCQGLIVTRGATGITTETRDRKEHSPAIRKEVFDVCGAGDTVTAAVALGIASGIDLFDSVQIANAAASVVVGKFGTATVSLGELQKTLQEAGHGSGNQTNS